MNNINYREDQLPIISYESGTMAVPAVPGAGKTFIVTNLDLQNSSLDTIVKIEKTNPLISPILSVIPLQLLAYYISKEKGLDVDKPRNLAKSVTVE